MKDLQEVPDLYELTCINTRPVPATRYTFCMSSLLVPSPELPDATADALHRLRDVGFAFVPGTTFESWLGPGPALPADWDAFVASWHGMPRDTYMADGGRYRMRRHATLFARPGATLPTPEPHQPHFQSVDYNTLNGGIARWFEPIPADLLNGPTMERIFTTCLDLFGTLRPQTAWHIEVHQFRIQASADEAGQPTPEGVHRDGVSFVLVMMVTRHNIASGTTTIHAPDGRLLDSFTLNGPCDAALVDDERCLHGVTPVTPIDPAQAAYRDVLVVTLRAR